jgi:hypothetical protein
MHSPCDSAGSERRVCRAEPAASRQIAAFTSPAGAKAGTGALLFDEGQIVRPGGTPWVVGVERSGFDTVATC